MEEYQEKHLSRIKSDFEKLVDAKYRKGQAEHGGDLLDLDISILVNYALDEAIDQVVYLLTIKQHLDKLDEIRKVILP